MRILPLMQNSYNGVCKAPTFKSIIRDVEDKNGNIINSNTTCFYRRDLDWRGLGDYLMYKYLDKDKVNVYSYGCSDGSEAMSLAILLKEGYDYKSRKFYPIYAKDNDEFILNRIRSSNIKMYFSDIDNVDEYSYNHLGRYFEIFPQTPQDESMIAHPTYELNSKIRYSKANALKDVHKLPSENTVLMIRNIMPYLGPKSQQDEFINNVITKLQKNCVVIIGTDEEQMGIGEKLENSGFVKTKLHHVYETVNK